MRFHRQIPLVLIGISLLGLSACGGGSLGSGNLFRSGSGDNAQENQPIRHERQVEERETIWDLFKYSDDPNTTVEVNKYIWSASMDVLNFMPVEAADPFSGVIVFGYGTPPGSGRAYKATVYVRDPALDARSLSVALHTRSGPASAEAVLAIEDAILTRARQLRIADNKL